MSSSRTRVLCLLLIFRFRVIPSSERVVNMALRAIPKTLVASATSLGDSILLIVALCFHSVFEGIAIGVVETKADARKALRTISLHKVFAAIAMGIALLQMMPNRPFLSCAAYAFAFAISSPIGVAIGILIDATTQGAVADWIFAISMGLACGVFIYVAINHLLAKGYRPDRAVSVDKPQYKFLAVLLGIGVIAVVMIWDTSSHCSCTICLWKIVVGSCLDPKLHHQPMQSRPLNGHRSQPLDEK
ncbi:unnamed protein product [Malus baccata var. baccata]